ncbi:hypothetical protein [Endozoicomonas arenosclerae]|uniref:hypothetical protein n=1 Tax=Endozoicomonas arenosclerae TaxID=1633495 RepID=UPI000AD73527|nr:hypothetical protein [Endozoicomonas arenosclerae]
MKGYSRLIFTFFLCLGVNVAHSDMTGLGKIIFTEGHSSPNCRIVGFKDNENGSVKHFRIKDVSGDDDVSSIAISALISGQNVEITYDPSRTTGCGSEPKITYIRLYK